MTCFNFSHCLCYCLAICVLPISSHRQERFLAGSVYLGRFSGCQWLGAERDVDPSTLLEKELSTNQVLSEAWARAQAEWARMKHAGRGGPWGLPEAQALSVVAYASEFPPPPSGPLYLHFNRATRACLRLEAHPERPERLERPVACSERLEACPERLKGSSEIPEACGHFRALGLLLGSALRTLREGGMGGEDAGIVYRGVPGPFWARVGRTVEFGSFTSTSGLREVAEAFAGQGGTLFHIRTARGALVEGLSPFPAEREVLIPPCEAFRVEKVQTSWVKGRRRVDLHLTSLDLIGGGAGGVPSSGGLTLLALTLASQWY